MRDVDLVRKSGGCCGKRQTLLCNATDAFQVNVNVEGDLLFSFSFATLNHTEIDNGVTAQVKEYTSLSLTRGNFLIEIYYQAVSRSVSIACSNGGISSGLLDSDDIIVNSELSSIKFTFC